eukprot:TRINITY_DN19929_c0_g1_i1.p1 TRINITY_DN19929_c0_g1~~TRINITY_DN19929_c0_g1_i1.p1  ORF type:complete len:314 (-),score=65.00 TRINITY_DN19929_c0_g1_i1:309-1166(-)
MAGRDDVIYTRTGPGEEQYGLFGNHYMQQYGGQIPDENIYARDEEDLMEDDESESTEDEAVEMRREGHRLDDAQLNYHGQHADHLEKLIRLGEQHHRVDYMEEERNDHADDRSEKSPELRQEEAQGRSQDEYNGVGRTAHEEDEDTGPLPASPATAVEKTRGLGIVGTLGLPLARVKRLIKEEGDIHLVSGEAGVLITKSVELFLELLTSETFKLMARDGRSAMQYKDIALAVNEQQCLDFLKDIVPTKVRVPKDYINKPTSDEENEEDNEPPPVHDDDTGYRSS